MGRGKRYDTSNKLNLKKVMAVLLALIVIVMFVLILVKTINTKDRKNTKTVPLGYFAIYENEKWGVINGEGEKIIEPTFDEMIAIPDNTKDVFVLTYDVNYENGEYKSKAINSKNKTLFGDYEKVEPITNYDKQHTLFYYPNCLKVQKNGKYGLIDLSGKQLIECLYDDITPVQYLKNSLIAVKDGKKGLISSTGTIIIDTEYSEIAGLTDTYEDGYIVRNENNKYGVIGTNKKVLVEVKYDEIIKAHSGNIYVAKVENDIKIIDSSTEIETTIDVDDIKSVEGENVIIVKDNLYGITNLSGEQKVEAKYQYLSYIFADYYIAQLDNKFGIIDVNGNVKIDFKYTNLTYRKDADIIEGTIEGDINSDLIDRNLEVRLKGIISEISISNGYMKVRVENEYKYFNFKFEEKKNTEIFTDNTLFLDKKDGKYGYKNKEGIVVVNYIYDDAKEQNKYGYAAVKKDGKWGAINSEGNVVVETKLQLDNNPIIDFIGQWHLCEDTSTGFYIK